MQLRFGSPRKRKHTLSLPEVEALSLTEQEPKKARANLENPLGVSFRLQVHEAVRSLLEEEVDGLLARGVLDRHAITSLVHELKIAFQFLCSKFDLHCRDMAEGSAISSLSDLHVSPFHPTSLTTPPDPHRHHHPHLRRGSDPHSADTPPGPLPQYHRGDVTSPRDLHHHPPDTPSRDDISPPHSPPVMSLSASHHHPQASERGPQPSTDLISRRDHPRQAHARGDTGSPPTTSPSPSPSRRHRDFSATCDRIVDCLWRIFPSHVTSLSDLRSLSSPFPGLSPRSPPSSVMRRIADDVLLLVPKWVACWSVRHVLATHILPAIQSQSLHPASDSWLLQEIRMTYFSVSESAQTGAGVGLAPAGPVQSPVATICMFPQVVDGCSKVLWETLPFGAGDTGSICEEVLGETMRMLAVWREENRPD